MSSTSAYSDSSTSSPKLPSICSLLSMTTNSRHSICTESCDSMIDSQHSRAKRRQGDLERRAQRAHRRLLRYLSNSCKNL